MTNIVFHAVLTVSWYCACSRCTPGLGLTASGRPPVEGRSIAVPQPIPLGTRVLVEGIGWRVADDRMPRRTERRGRIDIYVRSHREALERGISRRKVWVERK